MDTNKEHIIGKQVLHTDDIRKKITVKGEAFAVKFPNPIEQEKIEREIALRLGGSPLDSFPQIVYNSIRKCVTLDNILVDTPDWWTTAGECYDESITDELWEKYLEERDNFRRCLREGKFKKIS